MMDVHQLVSLKLAMHVQVHLTQFVPQFVAMAKCLTLKLVTMALKTQLAAIQLAMALLQATHVLEAIQLHPLYAQKFVEMGLSLQTKHVMTVIQI